MAALGGRTCEASGRPRGASPRRPAGPPERTARGKPACVRARAAARVSSTGRGAAGGRRAPRPPPHLAWAPRPARQGRCSRLSAARHLPSRGPWPQGPPQGQGQPRLRPALRGRGEQSPSFSFRLVVKLYKRSDFKPRYFVSKRRKAVKQFL